MHKKLLLMMLVPILALSLVVVGCGGDDGEFDGAGTYHRVAGIWYQVMEDADGNEILTSWFTAVGNQAAVYDGVGAAGVVSRTSFSFVGLPGNAMYRGRYVDQLAFRREFVRRLNEATFPGTTDLAFPPAAVTPVVPGSVVIPPGSTWMDLWQSNVGGTGVARDLANEVFMGMFPTGFFGREIRNLLTAGGTPLWMWLVWDGLLFDASTIADFDGVFMIDVSGVPTPGPHFMDNPDALFPWTLIPFRMNFHAFYGGREIGRISGFWAEEVVGVFDTQMLVVTESHVVEVAENLFIPPFGPYQRNMPEGSPSPQ